MIPRPRKTKVSRTIPRASRKSAGSPWNTRKPHEINHAANQYNQRRQKYSGAQQVSQNIFNPLIGSASIWKHLDPPGEPVMEHLNR
jgi:hypothetical protein